MARLRAGLSTPATGDGQAEAHNSNALTPFFAQKRLQMGLAVRLEMSPLSAASRASPMICPWGIRDTKYYKAYEAKVVADMVTAPPSV